MIRRARHGFTLVELLIVIGILLLLLGLGTIGYMHIDKVAAEKATRTRLDICSSMLNEYETAGVGLTAIEGPSGVYLATGTPLVTGPIPTPQDVNVGSLDRWSQLWVNPQPQPPYISNTRNPAVILTGTILQQMEHVPAVKAIISQLPPSAILQSNNVSNGIPQVWLDDSGPALSGTISAMTGNSLITGPAGLSVNTPSPVIVDGWKNPIIYVPTGGLLGVNITQGTNVLTVTVTAKDGRPFWASAGQDGNFINGDDNIYSTAVVYTPSVASVMK